MRQYPRKNDNSRTVSNGKGGRHYSGGARSEPISARIEQGNCNRLGTVRRYPGSKGNALGQYPVVNRQEVAGIQGQGAHRKATFRFGGDVN